MSTGFNRLVKKRHDNGPDTRAIPGFGGYRKEVENRRGTKIMQAHMGNHDGAPNPRGTGPFKKTKRSRGIPTNTRPTPGSAARIHNPQYN
jgi:hypothetical protein